MPRLPVVSNKRLIKALESLGFEVIRQRGSHVILKRGSDGCVVPLHKEIASGTLNAILKQSGISAERLEHALK